MSRLTIMALLTASSILTADSTAGSSQESTGKRCVVRTATRDIVDGLDTPPLFDLIQRPDHYDGCLVQVGGFMSHDFAEGLLYTTREDRALGGMLFGSVVVSFRNAKIKVDINELKEIAQSRVILVQGRFQAKRVNEHPARIVEVESYRGIFLSPSDRK
jgi:hypothetical protein